MVVVRIFTIESFYSSISRFLRECKTFSFTQNEKTKRKMA